MKLIKPSVEILEQESGLDGISRQIERVGRVCYKSEDKIADTSHTAFVDMIKARKHGAMLEHGTVYLFRKNEAEGLAWIHNTYGNNPYSKVVFDYGWHVTTNFRVIAENKWDEDLRYLCEPIKFHEKRVSVKFVCDRGVWNEFIRHRDCQKIDDEDVLYLGSISEDADKFSVAQESTRYVNYSKDKFGNEITCIIPSWLENTSIEGSYYLGDYLYKKDNDGLNVCIEGYLNHIDREFIRFLIKAESTYMYLIELGWKPQQARNVLPLATKTEIVLTGFMSHWKHFLELRCAENAHPQARELAIPLKQLFIEKGLI